MARTIAQIEAAIYAEIAANPVLALLLDSPSAVAEFAEWITVFANSEGDVEQLFDFFTADVNTTIGNMLPHTLQWYATIAKAFQYGVTLPADTDVYAVVPPVDPTVLIVNEAVAVEQVNFVRIKVAKLTAGVLGALSNPELTAFRTYMGRVKDAGVRLICTSGAADNLQSAMNIYYDPLVLKSDGSRIDGTATTPVKDAINAFLDALPFNGVFIYNDFVAAIQAVPGVVIGDVTLAQANYASTPYVDAKPKYVPDAGYLVLDSGYFDANVVYIPYGV